MKVGLDSQAGIFFGAEIRVYGRVVGEDMLDLADQRLQLHKRQPDHLAEACDAAAVVAVRKVCESKDEVEVFCRCIVAHLTVFLNELGEGNC